MSLPSMSHQRYAVLGFTAALASLVYAQTTTATVLG